MKYQVCAVWDEAAQCFGRPVFCGTVGLAVRSFEDECKREDINNEMFKHAEQFVLYHLGTYDDSEGLFDCAPRPVRLVKGGNGNV